LGEKQESKDQYKLGEGRCALSAELSILVIKCNTSFITSVSSSPMLSRCVGHGSFFLKYAITDPFCIHLKELFFFARE
jgi:hypothetical protein